MNERGKGLGWKSGFIPKHLSKLSDGSSKSSPPPPFSILKNDLSLILQKITYLQKNEGTNLIFMIFITKN